MRKLVSCGALALLLSVGVVSAQAVAQERSEAEKQAIAKIVQMGGQVIEVAQDDSRLDVAYHLADGTVSDDHLAPLADLKEVYSLNLRGTEVTDAGLKHIAGLSSLVRLHLEKTPITDDGLQHLSGLTNLEYLNLYGTKVTDAGLEHLKPLAKLQILYTWETGITMAGQQSL